VVLVTTVSERTAELDGLLCGVFTSNHGGECVGSSFPFLFSSLLKQSTRSCALSQMPQPGPPSKARRVSAPLGACFGVGVLVRHFKFRKASRAGTRVGCDARLSNLGASSMPGAWLRISGL
jgi:hypothetical protein